MANILFEPGSPSFMDLIGNGKIHVVPRYQRDYSWNYEEWDDLWNDIEGIKTEKIHYMGYVVLQKTDDPLKFLVIDGQQRITTLSILALGVIKVLEDWVEQGVDAANNKRRIAILSDKFIGFTPAASLMPVSKLHLNRNNDGFYKSYLIRRRKPTAIGKLKPSEKKMWRAFEFFCDKLKKRFDDDKDGATLSDFLETTISMNLVFTSITVGNDLNAYKVFETLNARGVKLSTGDLIKNYLFAEVAKTSEHDLDEAERQWQRINDILQQIELPVFLRHYWNSAHTLERKNTLYKALNSEVRGAAAVFNLLGDMDKLALVYTALDKPSDTLWSKEQAVLIEELSLVSRTQPFPLLLAAYKHIKPLDEAEFTKIIRDLVVVSFRYNTVSGLNPNTQEEAYNKTAIGISKGTYKTARDVFNGYTKELYVADEKFENDFTYMTMNTTRNKTLARYLLCKMERQLSAIPVDWNDSKVTIEHILPENPNSEWEKWFDAEQQNESIYRIGNLTLLETGKNKDCGNKLFAEKKDIYATSQYLLTKNKTCFNEWKPEVLLRRQQGMASLAKTVWKVQY
ncbi:MAG: DUF262 domain-containing protein [Deltaproteobacteria bacterium]|nr:DUF262 domain-containing protein [Deltaproteobacteria bacterium]